MYFNLQNYQYFHLGCKHADQFKRQVAGTVITKTFLKSVLGTDEGEFIRRCDKFYFRNEKLLHKLASKDRIAFREAIMANILIYSNCKRFVEKQILVRL